MHAQNECKERGEGRPGSRQPAQLAVHRGDMLHCMYKMYVHNTHPVQVNTVYVYVLQHSRAFSTCERFYTQLFFGERACN